MRQLLESEASDACSLLLLKSGAQQASHQPFLCLHRFLAIIDCTVSSGDGALDVKINEARKQHERMQETVVDSKVSSLLQLPLPEISHNR